MPVLNEEQHLAEAVGAILSQAYAGEQELVLALGPSSDATDEIALGIAASDHRVRIVRNPARDIPIGLNLAIEAAAHPIIVRVDAHSTLSPDYTDRAVTLLLETEAANIGGRMRAQGRTPIQRAIAGGYNSPLGLGGGSYHFSDVPHEAESAYLGVFPRTTHTMVGGFDPEIRRGEDWEFNLRVRRAGGRVLYAPSLQVTYWPRAHFGSLAQQFFATGSWRASLVRRDPRAHPWRFFVPGLFVLTVACALLIAGLQLAGLIAPSAWWPWILYAAPLLHVCVTFAAGIRMPETSGLRGALLGCFAVWVMHYAWGLGFLKGILCGSSRTVDRSRAR